jgi:uncharacterized protein YbjT (DUF2867 family)
MTMIPAEPFESSEICCEIRARIVIRRRGLYRIFRRMAAVFLTGSTGYMGRTLIGGLLADKHHVRALVRPGSESKVPPGCEVVPGDALDAASYRTRVTGADTFVHLVGVAHPSPAKADQFRAVDLVSIQAAVAAAKFAGVRHFVYVSVAHPAPMMKAYIEVRSAGEEMIRAAGLNATILRPWYVLGPRHRWPHALRPIYWLMERLPATRESARRLGLVTLEQMTGALLKAVETPASGVRLVEVPEIRRC